MESENISPPTPRQLCVYVCAGAGGSEFKKPAGAQW